MDALCFHEAGHAVVLKHLLGRVPKSIQLPQDGEDAQVKVPLGNPTSAREAERFAAYFAAGRIAVIEAKARQLLDAAVNPDDGYLGPPESGADSDLIAFLGEKHGASEAEAHGLARKAVKTYWDTVQSIAAALSGNGAIDQTQAAALLAGVPIAPR